MVYVEARVDVCCCFDDLVPYIAAWLFGVWCDGEILRRRVLQGRVEEFGVATFVGALVDFRHEGVVQAKDGGIVVQCCYGRGCELVLVQYPPATFLGLTVNHDIILVDRWVVDLDTLEVEMCGVVAIEHASSQIWNILASIALPGDVDLVTLHTESLNKSLPEVIELVGDINFILDC